MRCKTSRGGGEQTCAYLGGGRKLRAIQKKDYGFSSEVLEGNPMFLHQYEIGFKVSPSICLNIFQAFSASN